MIHYTNASVGYKRTIFGELFRMISEDFMDPLRFYHAKYIPKKDYILWISCINGSIKFIQTSLDDPNYIIPKEKRFEVLKASANLKYMTYKIEEWEYNVHNRTNVLAAEFPPVIWHYFMKKYRDRHSDYFPLAKKYASKKHKEPKHIDAKFYKFFSAYYSQKLLIEGF